MAEASRAVVLQPGGHVNLTCGPVICAIQTDAPLPPRAWRIVGELAYAVEKAADALGLVMEGGDDDDG